ncbi:MAG: T9SS type A sorting domain-containing protein [Candidatus Poribacteria bacterium]|nr:T9SS type A sorting domain-containing protein [Candidatus Poribacteria bacterium]
MDGRRIISGMLVGLLAFTIGAQAQDALVNDSTPGYYNAAIGTILDGTSSSFPVVGTDPVIFPAPEPDLSPAADILGNWLSAAPLPLNSHWSGLQAIPLEWEVPAETAIIYPIVAGPNGLLLTGDIAADNGIFVWVNGVFKFGAVEPGSAFPSEYANIDLGFVPPGENYIQVLREDHGGVAEASVTIFGVPPIDGNAELRQFTYQLPQGLSLFSAALIPTSLSNGDFTIGVSDGGGILHASDLIELGSTIVVSLEASAFFTAVGTDGQFRYGQDFAIEPGKGYVINLLTADSWQLIGTSHGVPVGTTDSNLTAPSIQPNIWAFAVAGAIPDMGILPNGTTLRILNDRTAEAISIPIDSNGRFAASFTDGTLNTVVEEGDTLRFELIDDSGYALRRFERVVQRDDLRNAYSVTDLFASPAQARLLPNYPNPFNPETWIPFELTEASDVSVHIYDLRGSLVKSLDLGYQTAGYHVSRTAAAYWDGRNAFGERVASGIYLYELRAGSYREARRMVILK